MELNRGSKSHLCVERQQMRLRVDDKIRNRLKKKALTISWGKGLEDKTLTDKSSPLSIFKRQFLF